MTSSPPATRPLSGLAVHAMVLAGVVLLSFLLYWPTLDNSFWHAEDFSFLETAQRLAEDPSPIRSLDAIERHHPVTLAFFLWEYRAFGFEPTGYYAVNLLLHGLNAFLVYWLVVALLPDRRIAILSGVLFALGVGSYGKALMFVAGVENLLITLLYLLLLNLYVRNDLRQAGRVRSWRYLGVLLLFLLLSFAKPTTFSLVGGILAYKVFFNRERGVKRSLLEPQLLILIVGAVVFWLVREMSGLVDFSHSMAGRNPFDFAVNFVKNMINYIVHMFFPIHVSRLVTTSNPLIRAIYEAAPVIRFVVGLSIVSYSLFGLVFGNRTIRFFIAWTFISVLPYCALRFPADWLNIRYLYQVAIGFTFIMASGTVLSMDLLHRRRWRRFVPYVIPLVFVILSAYITYSLDSKYEADGARPEAIESLEMLRARVEVDR